MLGMFLEDLVCFLAQNAAYSVTFLLELIKVVCIGLKTVMSVFMEFLYQDSGRKNGVVWMSEIQVSKCFSLELDEL